MRVIHYYAKSLQSFSKPRQIVSALTAIFALSAEVLREHVPSDLEPQLQVALTNISSEWPESPVLEVDVGFAFLVADG